MDTSLQNIYTYCEAHTFGPTELLSEVERTTHLKTLAPRMLSGHLQGSFLGMLSMLMKPNVILEIGTFTGYSALSLCKGLSSEGKLITIEYDAEMAALAEVAIQKSAYKNQIQLIIGDAKKVIPTLTETLDMVFIDADKEAYPLYFDLVIDKCRSGALIIADNVLWSGKVAEDFKDKKTAQIDAFNKKILADDRVEQVILPIRDGLSLIRKK